VREKEDLSPPINADKYRLGQSNLFVFYRRSSEAPCFEGAFCGLPGRLFLGLTTTSALGVIAWRTSGRRD
jgi:hypothetical protein